MLDRPSQLANAVLVFMLDNRGIRDPLNAYNAFVLQDQRDFGMSREEKGKRALEIIRHCLEKSVEDLMVIRDIEEEFGTLYYYGPTGSEQAAQGAS